ncbi:MAG: Gfo/Idh/MocA family oxidoreductase [Gemmatimonadetes bacterium]|nr:Gfo/Idh/MocA family oxidoreductase [Gemmatimonadota bacterium]
MSELRFGLIGCGDIGRLRAAALARTPGCRLIATSDADAQRARNLATRFHAQTDRDWLTLLQRNDVDAVIVSTPPALHARMCVAALEAGKHVLCEKPLARSSAECRTMVNAAARAKLQLATGFNYRFYPSFARAKELLAAGAIGELDHIRGYGGYSATSHNQPWVHDGGTVGGGALRDIGIHLIDLTRDFLGDVADVTGCLTSGVWNFPGCEDNGFVLLRNAAGRVATLQASWTEWRRYQFRIELYGTRGCIRATCFPMMLEVVSATTTGGPARRSTQLFPVTALGEKLRSYRWVVTRSFVDEFTAFAALVRGDPSRIATGEDGLRAIEIAERAAAGADATSGKANG